MPAQVHALSQQDELKQKAAWKAVEYVSSGMKLGLGTGSTAAFAVERIGDLLAKGELKDIVAVPTSIKTFEQAQSAPHTTRRATAVAGTHRSCMLACPYWTATHRITCLCTVSCSSGMNSATPSPCLALVSAADTVVNRG